MPRNPGGQAHRRRENHDAIYTDRSLRSGVGGDIETRFESDIIFFIFSLFLPPFFEEGSGKVPRSVENIVILISTL